MSGARSKEALFTVRVAAFAERDEAGRGGARRGGRMCWVSLSVQWRQQMTHSGGARSRAKAADQCGGLVMGRREGLCL